MFKESSVELTQKEILQYGQIIEVDFDHKRDSSSPTGTGIRPILAGFYEKNDGKRVSIDEKIVVQRIFQHLRNENIIDEQKWRYQWKPNHHWSGFDDDGYASSIYSVALKIYRQEFL